MTDEPEDFKLVPAEIHSACWTRLKAHIEERLDEFRKDNDGNLDFDQTTKLRGRIAELQYLLGVGIPDVPAPIADHDD